MPIYYTSEEEFPEHLHVYLEIDGGIAWLIVNDGDNDWYVVGLTEDGALCRASGIEGLKGMKTDKGGKIALDNDIDI